MTKHKRPTYPGHKPLENYSADGDGRVRPLAPEDVHHMIRKQATEGTLVAVILDGPDGYAVRVFGPPSATVLQALEQIADEYRRMLEKL